MSSQVNNMASNSDDQVSDLHNYLDSFSKAVGIADNPPDNPVDDWADHMERQAKFQDEAKRKSGGLSKAETATGDSGDVLELHPSDEPMDVTPVEPAGKELGPNCIWRLEDDLSNLPAVGSPQPRQIRYKGQWMSCQKRIELATAYVWQHRLFPRRFFTKSLSILQRDETQIPRGSELVKESKEEVKPLGAQPTPVSGPSPKPRDLQARTSPPILVEKPKGPAGGKKAKKKSKASKSLPKAQAKVEQPRAVNPKPAAKEPAKVKQPPAAKPQPAPKAVGTPRKEPVSGPSRKGAKRKGGPAPAPKNLAPKSGKLEPVAENSIATMALTQLGGMQAMVVDLQAKLDRATRSEVKLSTQLERATMDVRALLEFIKDHGLEAPPTYSTR